MTITTGVGRLVTANRLDIYVEQVGQGPDVLLIGGAGDTVESWQFQLDGLADWYSSSRPERCRAVAELIPGAQFEVMEEECHQPFQEVPDDWNTRVEAFWRDVERAA